MMQSRVLRPLRASAAVAAAQRFGLSTALTVHAVPAARWHALPRLAIGGSLLCAAWLWSADASGVHAAKAKATAGMFELSQADFMHDNPHRHTSAEAVEFLRGLAEKHDHDARVLWRYARALYNMSEDAATAKGEKQALMEQALAVVKQSCELDAGDGDMHRWFGIILSGMGQYQATKEYIANSFVIRSEWKQAVALNPDDASAHHLLGRWAFDVASMSWLKRKLAATLFAEPPTATYDEALTEFERAEAISPGFWKKNLVMMAKTLCKLNRKAEAVPALESALAIKVVTAEDKEAHAEGEALLKTLQ